MVITTKEIKQQMKGVGIAIFTWMIVANARELLIEVSPIKDQMVLGVIGLVLILSWKV